MATRSAGLSSALSKASAPKVLIATTAMLSFISFWRAAAVVLNDMGSSAFYAGAISEHFIGKTAPWFILAIMVLAYGVRSIYIESCSMFVRGGVYRVVKEAMGATLAKFSVSALMFDYILTGPISGVSAGLYITGLLNELFGYAHLHLTLPMNATAAVFAIMATLYFWRENIKGLHESSDKALRIMYITTVMVVVMIGWCLYTLAVRGGHLPPLPTLATVTYADDALGWLGRTRLPFTLVTMAILIGLGHSVLAMSGEETMAQVYREIEHPKLKNLEKAGFVIFVYSLVFTAGVAFFGVMIVPDAVRATFFDNPIGGLTMYLAGPLPLRLVFRGFVAVVGTLMLAGAVNTSIVGSNGVLNRVSEDGILPPWFRQPHLKFGTSHRILNLVVALQIVTIVLSGGNIFVLGEAYAFGVMWSFALKGLAVLVLRYRQPGARDFRVPFNVTIAGLEIPIGLAVMTAILFALCLTNLFTKQVATVSGAAFTVIFFLVFSASERATRKHAAATHAELDQFNVAAQDGLTPEALSVNPGCILVPIRNANTLDNLKTVLSRVDTARQSVVALHLRFLQRVGGGEFELTPEQLFSVEEQRLFTRALELAEKEGKTIHLAVAAATDRWEAIVRAAHGLQASSIAIGASPTSPVSEEARLAGLAWERLPEPKTQLMLSVHFPNGQEQVSYLGPHAPHLTQKEIDLLHGIWLRASQEMAPVELHHHDVIHFALQGLEHRMDGQAHDEVMNGLRQHVEALPRGRKELAREAK